MRLELMQLVGAKLEFILGLDRANLPVRYKEHAEHIETIHKRVEGKGAKEEFVEEIAYTWFNRLVALRFMDANSITELKVLTPLQEGANPEIFSHAKDGKIDEVLQLDRTKFYDLIDGKIKSINPENEAYSMLFVAVCNYYSHLMPFMFEAIADYTELLLPDDLLSSNSVRAKVVDAMRVDECEDVEIIGWLYQFYISEKKDAVFEKLKKNVKITPSNIPAATQLFTPHWIVKYMVENSLGKIWMLNRPNSSLKEHMKYYIQEETPTETFLKVSIPQELTLLDPCCGSGHVLTYAFELLTLIYEEEGYAKSDIPALILEHNLFGCDIDKRAATLANFALTMKARLYNRRFFKKSVKPNVLELESFDSDEFAGIKNFGSLLTPHAKTQMQEGIFGYSSKEYELQRKILSSEFACVVTNPPYMGGKGMNKELSDFVKSRYPDSKSDLFAVFMERCLELTCQNGFMSMINQHSWMFLSSYEKLREKIIKNHKIDTMVHLGARAFEEIGGEVVQSVAFVLQKGK